MTNKIECNCSLSIKLCGDGCMKCQPETYIFNLENALQAAEQEIEQLRSEVESLKKVPVFNRLTHKIVPIEPDEDMRIAFMASLMSDEPKYFALKASILAAPEYQSQAQQTESKPALKVHNGEICYQSTDDDQCYGMWCPVSYDTEHSYKEGTKFIAIPPAPEGDKS